MLGQALLLLAALIAFGWYLKGGPFGPGFLAGRRFVRLAARSATLFGGVSLVALALAGRLDALAAMPVEFAGPALAARTWAPGMADPLMLAFITAGLLIGSGLGALLSWWRGRIFAFGDITAVLPRSRGELGWAALLALQSGISEELFFRLLLPLLLAGVTGSAWVGFVGATALFGFAHRYQGWSGVAATTVVGALMSLLYLASGRLWMAVALHMAINLNGLVLRPLTMGVWRRR